MSDRGENIPRFLDPEEIIPISRMSTAITKTGEWSPVKPTFAEKASPCRVDCPNGNNIPLALSYAAKGDFDGALAAFLEESPIPGVCGLVCDHPCQINCNRAPLDKAVEIRRLERGAAAFGNAEPKKLTSAGAGMEVAVAGGGPAGIGAAYHLARMGFEVTVYEKDKNPGGLLYSGIPGFRLPKDLLERELSRLGGLGITYKTGVTLDATTLSNLSKANKAVVLALGATTEPELEVNGNDLPGVLKGLEFLKDPSQWPKAKGAKVVVIGGGNTALDAARTSIRAGAESVTVVYRRGEAQMPAFAEEVLEAREEGVEFRFNCGPAAFIGDGGNLNALKCVKTASGLERTSTLTTADETGFEIPCDLALTALGQKPLLSALPWDLRQEGGGIWSDLRGCTSVPLVYAGGDLTPKGGSVVKALAAGKRAALGVHLALTASSTYGRVLGAELGDGSSLAINSYFAPPPHWEPELVARMDELDYLGVEIRLPAEESRIDPAIRASGFGPVLSAPTRDAAISEASRCFFCGTCVGCDKCRLYCPDGSMGPVHNGAGGQAYLPDNDYCKGCGSCAEACPRGVLTMKKGAD